MSQQRKLVFINARFLTEPLTGVQRYGREMLSAWDGMLADGTIDRERYRFIALMPSPALEGTHYEHIEMRVAGRMRSHLWEQISLPRLAKGGFLINLKNTAPLRHPNFSMVIHDLQVIGAPETHSGLFKKYYTWNLPRAVKRAKAVAAVSQATAAEIEKYFGYPQAMITVTTEGHEHIQRIESQEDILKREKLETRGYLLAVSSLNPNKNFAAILRAMTLAQVQVPLVIAGGTNPRVFEGTELLDSLPENARHVGRVSDGELRALYEHALGFVFPSFYEGWGLPPGEAMQLGCPVIVSNTTSLPEVCGDAALYCDPADDASIAKQMRRLVEDSALRHELSGMGRARALTFSWRKAAERLWQQLAPAIAHLDS